MTEWADYGPDGKLEMKSIAKYDDKGNKLEQDGFDSQTKPAVKETFKYDANGNILEQTKYEIKEINGKSREVPVSQIVIEYEFYPAQ